MLNNIQLVLGIILIISSLIVVSARNPIHRIAALVIVFIIGAFIFMILDYYFLGLTYIIVYVGAIAILFLFVIMMVEIPLISSKTLIRYEPKEIITSSLKNKNNINKKININNSQSIINDKNISLVFKNTSNNIKNNNQNIMIIKNEIKNIFKNPNLILLSIIFFIFIGYNILINNNDNIYTYIYTTWAIEYKTITDIENLAIIIYNGYPIILILIAITLWIILIGIISICKS